jgi:hypothetical protein
MLHRTLFRYFFLFTAMLPCRPATAQHEYVAGTVHKPTKNYQYNGHQADTEEGKWEVGNWRLWLTTPVND